ncbi:hypothetical protein NDU88_004053 [Pleurodeles waltl]|uniref:Uncharacterized protein n=1 Tax=Pleurodeles waltl TaxID=8319 RepID=A0AAV7TRF9_PLEWA|nr:hypothetical protein NDU88_004053 [Pleurodeles waltl]
MLRDICEVSGKTENENVVSLPDFVDEFKDVFSDKLGCLTKYVHRIKIKEGSVPVVFKGVFGTSHEDEFSMCRVTEGIIEQDEWVRAVADDSVLQRVCESLRSYWHSDMKHDEALRGFWTVKDELSVANGRLLRRTGNLPELVRRSCCAHAGSEPAHCYRWENTLKIARSSPVFYSTLAAPET